VEVSEETIEFLRKQAWAQVEANQLKQDELAVERAKVEAHMLDLHLADKELELKRQIESRRDGRLAEVIARYADLGEQVTGLVETGRIADVIMREGFEEFSGEVRIIKRGLYALLSRDGGEIQKVKQELRAEFEREEIQELLIKHRRTLQKLKEQQASFGLMAPVHLLTQIEDTEREIQRLQEQLSP
jgi:hypothetical protein